MFPRSMWGWASDDDKGTDGDGWSFWRSLTSKLETPILAMLIFVVLALLLLPLPLLLFVVGWYFS